MKYEDVQRGYNNLWAKATLRPERKATVLAKARKIATNKQRYQQLEARTGVPWWWIAVAHNLEGNGNFNTYLGNGQSLNRVTSIVPKGRGPFASFEDGAIDAIKLKGLEKIKVWDIPRALFHWEQFNGFGYMSKKINSPYVWSMTNLYTKGKYVRDHVYDSEAVSDQIGAAAMMLGLIELGEVRKETTMADLQASLLPFDKLAPTLIRVLAGPAAGLAVRVLAEVIEEVTGESVPAKPEDVKRRVDDMTTAKLTSTITKAEDQLSDLVPATPIVRADEPLSDIAVIIERLRKAEETITAMKTQTVSTDNQAQGTQNVTATASQTTSGQQTVSAGPGGVVSVQPVKPEPSKFEQLTGGWMTGWKTNAGIVIYVVGHVLGALGYIDQTSADAVGTIGVGLAGVGVIAKIERWLPLFAGFLRYKK